MKDELNVRPLARGEENLWCSLGVPESDKEIRTEKLIEYLAQNPGLPPENYLLALHQGQVVGKMSGILESTGYIATKIVLREADENVASALFKRVRQFGPLQALSWADREDDRDWRKILERNGFEIVQDKAYFRREIAEYSPPLKDHFTYRSMADVGRSEMLKIFALTYTDHLNRNFSSSPEADFASHVEAAGPLFDPNHWYIAYSDGQAIGVLLPQRFPDLPSEGTLTSFGILKEHRRRGFGRMLHASGLEILRHQGATRYIGSTDIRNVAMIRIFESNGCKRIGTRTTHQDRS